MHNVVYLSSGQMQRLVEESQFLTPPPRLAVKASKLIRRFLPKSSSGQVAGGFFLNPTCTSPPGWFADLLTEPFDKVGAIAVNTDSQSVDAILAHEAIHQDRWLDGFIKNEWSIVNLLREEWVAYYHMCPVDQISAKVLMAIIATGGALASVTLSVVMAAPDDIITHIDL
jgi:hypothetical protein